MVGDLSSPRREASTESMRSASFPSRRAATVADSAVTTTCARTMRLRRGQPCEPPRAAPPRKSRCERTQGRIPGHRIRVPAENDEPARSVAPSPPASPRRSVALVAWMQRRSKRRSERRQAAESGSRLGPVAVQASSPTELRRIETDGIIVALARAAARTPRSSAPSPTSDGTDAGPTRRRADASGRGRGGERGRFRRARGGVAAAPDGGRRRRGRRLGEAAGNTSLERALDGRETFGGWRGRRGAELSRAGTGDSRPRHRLEQRVAGD